MRSHHIAPTGHLNLTHPTSAVDWEEVDKPPFQTGTQFLVPAGKSSRGCNQKTQLQQHERSQQGQGIDKYISQEVNFSWEVRMNSFFQFAWLYHESVFN